LKGLYFVGREDKPPRNIFLFTDGHVSCEDNVIDLIRENSAHTRLFTFGKFLIQTSKKQSVFPIDKKGIGEEANRHMIKTMARYGAGAFEFLEMQLDSNDMQKKVLRQVKRAFRPCFRDIQVKWMTSTNRIPLQQAPATLPAIFKGDRVIIYGKKNSHILAIFYNLSSMLSSRANGLLHVCRIASEGYSLDTPACICR